MLEVVQAFDPTHIVELPTDDIATLESKLAIARACFLDRGGRLARHERIAVLHKLAIQWDSSATLSRFPSRGRAASPIPMLLSRPTARSMASGWHGPECT